MDRLKNAIRGSANPVGAIAQLRSTVPQQLVGPLAAWGSRSLSLIGPLRSLRPRRLRELQGGNHLPPLDLEREIEWTGGVFHGRAQRIGNFVATRTALEEAFLTGDANKVLYLLDELDKREGYTLWSIATRIGLIQAFYGIEAQKGWVSQLREKGASDEVMFFAFWWSVRAEEGTTPERYLIE